MKKLSIITICYNDHNLENTCKSIVEQSWQDFEWIVIDGGSNIETQKIWDKYKYRIDKFVSEPDKGIYNAQNKGIKLANGEFLNFLNSGDFFYDKDVLKNIFENKTYKEDILYGNQIYIAHNNCIMKMPEKITKSFLITSAIRHQSSFIKKELFEKYGLYREDLKISSDHEKFIKFFAEKAKFKHLALTMTYYAGGGISSENGDVSLREMERDEINKSYFTEKEIEKAKKIYFKNKNLPKYSFMERVFSIKNTKDKKYKIITILGIKFKFRKDKNI